MAKTKNIVKVIDGVGFYPLPEGKTEAQFVEENHSSGLSDEQLKNAYGKLSKKDAPAENEKTTPTTILGEPGIIKSKKNQPLDNGSGN